VIILREVPECKFEGSTAGWGKPHARWCGRGGGHHPATSTRSTLLSRILGFFT
jgi:hypothetical protein